MLDSSALLLGAAAATPLLYARAFADTPRDTIVMAKRIDDIISLDPQEAFEYSGNEISGNVYEKLVTPDDENPTQITPTLAESWTASADGQDLDVQDARRPQVRQRRARHRRGRRVQPAARGDPEQVAGLHHRPVRLRQGQRGASASARRTRSTLQIEIAERQAPTFLLYCLSAAVGGVVEKKVVMSHEQGGDLGNGWLKTNSAGSGPFVIRSARGRASW